MSDNPQSVEVDVTLFGGGIAGLWLLNLLRKKGYRALLLESGNIGGGQTRYSQGIIHGGTKYALSGKLTDSSEAIAEMPAFWRSCLRGEGELDLSSVKLLSEFQYLWSTASITSRMAGFFASKMMRSRTAVLDESERPKLFQGKGFRGQVYRLDEPVLEIASLLAALSGSVLDNILRYDTDGLAITPGKVELQAEGRCLTINTRIIVLTAGKGNASLLKAMGRTTPAMQIRPLQMVMARGGLPADIYAHCLGASANPRITISSHLDAAGETVWYLGGQLAEEGVALSAEEQIAAAKEEIGSLFPWLDISNTEFAALPIDRAEIKQDDGSRPADAWAEMDEGVITAWPTKLAFAPRLANHIIDLLEQNQVQPGGGVMENIDWPLATMASLPWQEEERWS